MEQWLYWFRELCAADREKVGKKCANLGELTSLGLRVPPGFAISIAGFDMFMTMTGTGEEVKDYIAGVQGDLATVEGRASVSRRVRELIESPDMPPEMGDRILIHYHELCRLSGHGDALAVAVRSSGSVSMPGQMETYLNVTGDREVLLHVKKVWASAYTPRAIAFRIEKGLPLDRAPIGVAIMSLVDATAAGVVLTVIPTTGDRSKIVIEGNWGLGESVVSGTITPDSFTVDKETLEIVERRVARKTGVIEKCPSGTVYHEMSGPLREEPCLQDREIKELARVAARVESHFGEPQDMEWAVKEEGTGPAVYWLQARSARYRLRSESDERDYLIDLMAAIFGSN